MNVLSLFDGMSCGQIALNRAGIAYEKYYAAEIDKNAIKVTMANYPDTIQLGDVKNIHYTNLGLEVDLSYSKTQCYSGDIDLIIGGSPCQGFSFAGQQSNFNDPRSKLFFEYVRILNEIKAVNPKVLFLLENVKMAEEHEAVISKYLGVKPIRLNSALVSAQNRERLYWTNIHVNSIPKNTYSRLCDIIEPGFWADRNKAYCIDANYGKGTNFRRYFFCGSRQLVLENGYSPEYLTKTTANKRMHEDGNRWRKLTVNECEKLQTVPINYTNHASDQNRYKMLGNGWTVDIIVHILKHTKLSAKTI